MGVYISGPAWGRVVDSKGPRIPLISAFACLLIGYLGIKRIYDDGTGTVASFMHIVILISCTFMTGFAGNAGLAVAMNTTAKSFPDTSVCFCTMFYASVSHAEAMVFLCSAEP